MFYLSKNHVKNHDHSVNNRKITLNETHCEKICTPTVSGPTVCPRDIYRHFKQYPDVFNS